MNLDTAPTEQAFGRLKLLIIGEDSTRPRVPLTFDVAFGGIPDEHLPILSHALQYFSGVYHLRGFSMESPFLVYRQSGVNLIGSVNESIALDLRYYLWGKFQASGFTGEGWFVKLTPVVCPPDCIDVSVDGTLLTLRPTLTFGEHYRTDCETCQQGRGLLQHAFSLLKDSIIVDSSTFDGVTYEYGDTRVKADQNDHGFHASNLYDYLDDGVSSAAMGFVEWFKFLNQGAIDMTHVDVTFQVV